MSSYEYAYLMEELAGAGVFSALMQIPSTILSIAAYVLTSLALYTLASRRGLSKPWLAWIPIANVWIIGSLSDQYRYVVMGETKSKRKVLLTLSILSFVFTTAIVIAAVVMGIGLITSGIYGASEAELMEGMIGPVIMILGLCIPLMSISIASLVVRYMAMYDIYKSMDPRNCVMFLVLSIIFKVTEPFFLFFNRTKDLGMPPRRQAPQYAPQQEPVQEPWEADSKDYL